MSRRILHGIDADHVGGPAAFFGLGVGLQLATVAVLPLLFRRRGWL